MSININNATYGQPPYFDNSTLNFDPIGDEYTYGLVGDNLPGYNRAIQYGQSFGNSRVRLEDMAKCHQYHLVEKLVEY